jgi:hypothetical protein
MKQWPDVASLPVLNKFTHGMSAKDQHDSLQQKQTCCLQRKADHTAGSSQLSRAPVANCMHSASLSQTEYAAGHSGDAAQQRSHPKPQIMQQMQ